MDVGTTYSVTVDVELAAVGRNVSELRASKGLRLADLAELTGYTTSYLSQIERGVSIPSLTALATVAAALGVEMSTLLDHSTGPKVHITRSGEAPEIRLPPNNMHFRVVGTHGPDGAYTALIQNVPDEPMVDRHFGERFVLVLEGELTISFGDNHHQLEPGDTIHYGAHETHRYVGGDGPVELLIVSSPALF